MSEANPTARDALVAALRGLFPKWRIIDDESPAGETYKTTVRVSQRGVVNHPDYPRDRFEVRFELTLWNEYKTPAAVERHLDDEIVELCSGLKASHLRWEGFEKEPDDEIKRLVYAGAVYVPAKKVSV